jgi:hypothetical protein
MFFMSISYRNGDFRYHSPRIVSGVTRWNPLKVMVYNCWVVRLCETAHPALRDTRPDAQGHRDVYRHGIRLADLRTPARLGFNNVFETNFGLVHAPDRTKANMRAYMWDKLKDWLLHGAIEADEKMRWSASRG